MACCSLAEGQKVLHFYSSYSAENKALSYLYMLFMFHAMSGAQTQATSIVAHPHCTCT